MELLSILRLTPISSKVCSLIVKSHRKDYLIPFADKRLSMKSFDYLISSGGPRVNLGPCVYMDVNTGYWYSGNCSQAILGYGCKYTLNRGGKDTIRREKGPFQFHYAVTMIIRRLLPFGTNVTSPSSHAVLTMLQEFAGIVNVEL